MLSNQVEVIIQARMGSTRFPGKVMKDLCGKPILWHVIERVKLCDLIGNIVVATSNLETDDVIEKYLDSIDVKCYRGDELDVLSRYYYAARQYPADDIIRITADCPLIDSHVLSLLIDKYYQSGCEYVSNVGDKRTYPRGLDCEIFSYSLLERAFKQATKSYEREHVTPYMYWEQKSVGFIENPIDYSALRLTVDTKQDFELISNVYNHFYKGNHDFFMEDICSYLEQNPELCKLNQDIEQKPTR